MTLSATVLKGGGDLELVLGKGPGVAANLPVLARGLTRALRLYLGESTGPTLTS